MIANLQPRNSRRELLVLAGGAALLVLAGASLLTPRLRSVTLLSQQIAADAATARQLEQELAPYAQLLAAGGGPAPVRVLGSEQPEGAVPDLLDRLAELGRTCALQVTAMLPITSEPRVLPPPPVTVGGEAGSGPRGYRILTVAIEAEASFAGLGRYFEALSELDVPLTVLALDLEPAGRDGSDQVRARFTLGTWVLTGAGSGAGGRDEAA